MLKMELISYKGMVVFSTGPTAVERLAQWVLHRGSMAASEMHNTHERER